MLSQYYLIVDANTLAADPPRHSHHHHRLLFLEEIQKALSLSLNLYALAKQESKIRDLTNPQPAMIPPENSLKMQFKMSINPNRLVLSHQRKFSEKNNSAQFGDYFCKTKLESLRGGAILGVKSNDMEQLCLERGASLLDGEKIKIKKISSGRLKVKRTRMISKRVRPGEEAIRSALRAAVKFSIGTATIEGRLSASALRSKREELMDRWVRSWNPEKDESYIKNREFRMLLRN